MARYYDALRHDTGCLMNLDLQRIAEAVTPITITRVAISAAPSRVNGTRRARASEASAAAVSAVTVMMGAVRANVAAGTAKPAGREPDVRGGRRPPSFVVPASGIM